RAARLFGAAEALYAATGGSVSPVERGTYERHLAAARAQLDGGAWAAAWAEGRAMPLERAVAHALEPPPSTGQAEATPRPPGEAAPRPAYPAGLTAREVE